MHTIFLNKFFFEKRFKTYHEKLGKVTNFFFTDRKKIPSEVIINKLNKNSAVIFREYDLEKNERFYLAQKIRRICKQRGCLFFVGKDLDLALKIKADGVHLSDKDNLSKLKLLYRKNINSNFLMSLSCHDYKMIKKHNNSFADLFFISPIFKTSSHPDSKYLGKEYLDKCCAISNKPIFALGGVDSDNLKIISLGKSSGFGAISFYKTLL